MKPQTQTLTWLLAMTCLVAVVPQPAAAQLPAGPGATRLVSDGLSPDGQLKLMVNKTAVVTTRVPYKRVSVGQPDIADVSPIGPTSILVTAKKSGTTQLILWDDTDHTQVIDVLVQFDIQALQAQLKNMFPGANIEAAAVNGSVALRGRVPNLEIAGQAAQVATPYVSGASVLNFLEVSGGQQVMLQVRFAEISRSATSALGVNLGFTDGHTILGTNNSGAAGFSLITEDRVNFLGVPQTNTGFTLFGQGELGNSALVGFLNALRQNNLARILAEPNLIATSGQDASFLAGGEFPIPITQGGGSGSPAITIEYRQFGVRLNFTPVVLGDGKIRLKVSPEVSDLDFTTAVRFNGFIIPGLTSRKVTTTIELCDGQSFAIAGLLNNSTVSTKDVTPLLGDLPIVGALFRSVRYQHKETELVVLVTPRLVEPMNPAQVPALPGETWRNPTENQLFWDQDLGGPASDVKAPATQPVANRPAPRFHGDHGFMPLAQTSQEPRQ